ncbi:uncharacterized protein PG998_011875 [Apiospora kogelbergensis]|uniref:uncharacterized protein n=1 Tax=Apiospora kogelbergensis TaxID=1337665 RepID=UPI00312E18FE
MEILRRVIGLQDAFTSLFFPIYGSPTRRTQSGIVGDGIDGDVELDGEGIAPRGTSATSPALPHYPYGTLSLTPRMRQIRVFDLDGVCDQWDTSPIRGFMRLVDLDDSPAFNALSYVWGDYSSPTRDTIACDGFEIEVTKNCLSALRHLRKTFGAMTIWVDGICIDQLGLSEKVHQIPLMGPVYSSAQTVYAWLGEGNSRSNRGMDFIAQGLFPSRVFPFDFAAFQGRKVSTSSNMLRALRHAQHISLGLWASKVIIEGDGALREIFSRPWINRLWTFQEAVLPRKLLIVCGTKAVPWPAFLKFLEYMEIIRAYDHSLGKWFRLKNTWRLYHHGSRVQGRGLSDLEGNWSLPNVSRDYKETLEEAQPWVIAIWTLQTSLFLSAILGLWLAVFQLKPLLPYPAFHIVFLPFLASISSAVLWLLYFQWRGAVIWLRSLSAYSLASGHSLALDIAARQATVAEDKFFGVYGFIHGQQRNRRAVDYTNTTLDILYRLLFKQVVSFTGSLDILLLTPARMSRSPTWVIDWRSAPSDWVRSLARYHSGATPGSEPAHRFWGGKELRVRAMVVSQITFSTGPMGGYRLGSLLDAGFDPALLLIYCWPKHNSVPLDLMVLTEVGARWTKRVRAINGLYWILRWMEGVPGGKVIERELFRDLAHRRAGLVQCSSTGLNDHGYAPEAAVNGDSVALISGVSLPMILRKRERRRDQYEVVGPAFFPSVMNGKLWGRIDKNNLDELVLV